MRSERPENFRVKIYRFIAKEYPTDPVIEGKTGAQLIAALADEFDAEVLDESPVSCTVQLTGRPAEIDKFIHEVAGIGDLSAVARSGSVAVSKGEVTLSSYTRHHRLTG